VKKQGLTWKSRTLLFSKFIVEIRKKRKRKSGFLMFAGLNAEKDSPDYCHIIKKRREKAGFDSFQSLTRSKKA
jgi:IS5 family transposase